MAKSNDKTAPERAFEADDINPEIVAAIDEIQDRRQLEIESKSAQAGQQRARMTRISTLVILACIAGAVYALL